MKSESARLTFIRRRCVVHSLVGRGLKVCVCWFILVLTQFLSLLHRFWPGPRKRDLGSNRGHNFLTSTSALVSGRGRSPRPRARNSASGLCHPYIYICKLAVCTMVTAIGAVVHVDGCADVHNTKSWALWQRKPAFGSSSNRARHSITIIATSK
jgi:hypothetical protein